MFSQEHMLLQWTALFRKGTAATAPAFESAVGSLRFGGPTAIEWAGQENCDALANILSTWWGDGAMFIPSNCFLTTVKWNRIDRNGHYKDSGQTVLTDFTGVPGARTPSFPTQIAWATTWDTDKTRGRAARGRTYWPTGVGILPLENVVDATTAQTKANMDLRLINALTAQFSGSVPDSIWPAVMSDIGEGTTNRITGSRVGVRLDIQRRRGKGIDEAYRVGTTA